MAEDSEDVYKGDDISEYGPEEEVAYEEETNNVGMNFKSKNHQKNEEMELKRQPLSHTEKKRMADLHKIFKNMLSKKEDIESAITRKIMDKKTLKNLEL